MSSKHVLPWAVRLPCSGGPVLFHVWFYLTLTLVSGCTDRDQARMGVGSAALAACDDGNPCTADLAFCPEGPNVPPELCPNLQCFHHPYPALPGEPHPFDDGNACTIDTCDPVEGIRHVVAVGAACDTDGDICSGVGICDTQGQCVVGAPAPDGTECDDGDICNGIDTCLGGGCQPPAAPAPAGINCWDGMNGCVAATCDGYGACVQSALPWQPCDDGNACTVEDLCNSAGQCAGTSVDEGTSCADEDGCNGAETCQTGVCIPGTPLSVDDGDENTIDACDPSTGTVHHADCSAILDLTVTTTLDVAAACLYQGPAPLQVALDGTPLPAGTFDAKRVAIVRGHTARGRTPHLTGERNVNPAEEHSRVAKGAGRGAPRRGCP